MCATVRIAALLLLIASQPANAETLSPRAAFDRAYTRALWQEKCSRVDAYLLATRPAEAKGRSVGAVKSGLEGPLKRLQRLRTVARAKGLSASMRHAETRWRKLDATAGYVCRWDSVRTPRAFEQALDEMEAQLRRL